MERVATCSMTDGNGSYHGLASSFSKRRHVADVKHIAGDGQTTLIVHRNSTNIACTFRIYVCAVTTVVSAADGSGRKHHRRWPESIEIPQIRKFMHTRSSKASRKTSFYCYERRRDWRHCAPFTFLLSLVAAFVFTFEKYFLDDLDPHRKTEIYIL